MFWTMFPPQKIDDTWDDHQFNRSDDVPPKKYQTHIQSYMLHEVMSQVEVPYFPTQNLQIFNRFSTWKHPCYIPPRPRVETAPAKGGLPMCDPGGSGAPKFVGSEWSVTAKKGRLDNLGCFQKIQIPNKSVKWIINGNTISWGLCAQYTETRYLTTCWYDLSFLVEVNIGKSQGCTLLQCSFKSQGSGPPNLPPIKGSLLIFVAPFFFNWSFFVSPNCLTNFKFGISICWKKHGPFNPPIPCGVSLDPPPHQPEARRGADFCWQPRHVMPRIKFVGSNRETKIWVFQGYIEQNPRW